MAIDNVTKKKKLRTNCAAFSIIIAVFTFIGAFALPLIAGVSLKNTEVLISIAIAVVLGLAFLVLGIWFLKKDSRGVAIAMIIMFILYVVDRVYLLADGGNIAVIVWLVLGIMQIVQLVQFLRIKDKEQVEALQQPQQPAPPPTTNNTW